MQKLSFFLVVGVLLVAAGALYFTLHTTKTKQTQPQEAHEQSSSNTHLANPASTNCTEQGGTLSIEKRGDGGEYGLCNFEDDMSCEEWVLYRGECPVGGVKTTGFDNIEQMYCAWVGGHTLAEPNATCSLPNGHTCSVDALYNGTCS